MILEKSILPILSFCIPTYNRCKYLDILLASIYKQKFEFPYEVHIRNNASTDDTELVAKRYCENRGNWFYTVNDENIGGRRNILECTRDAAGEYCIIIGDDDFLISDASAIIANLVKVARASHANAILMSSRLKGGFYPARVCSESFEWLRYVSVNVPAFISGVIWKTEFWKNYKYESYRQDFSLPQLDCFVEACLAGAIVGCEKEIVSVGHAESSSDPKYWFYARHPLVDCFEYPALYKKILLPQNKVNLKTRIFVQLRRLALTREIVKKVLLLRYNDQYYHPSVNKFEEHHSHTFYWIILKPVLKIILNTKFGDRLAGAYCSGQKKLPVQDMPTHRF